MLGQSGSTLKINWKQILNLCANNFRRAINKQKYYSLNTCEILVASLTGRFVSAKRLFRDLQNLQANSLSIAPKESPVRKFKILAVWPSIAERFPTACTRTARSLFANPSSNQILTHQCKKKYEVF